MSEGSTVLKKRLTPDATPIHQNENVLRGTCVFVSVEKPSHHARPTAAMTNDSTVYILGPDVVICAEKCSCIYIYCRRESGGMEVIHVSGELLEASLDGVHTDDRNLVREVLSIMHVFYRNNGLLKDWQVRVLTNLTQITAYEICTTIDTQPNGDWEVQFSDLEMIRELDFARIGPIRVRGTGSSAQLVVYVNSKLVPMMVTHTDIIRVSKKRKLWGQSK
jgi:hypothetical protein